MILEEILLLLIQKINLIWHKNERGAKGEKARRQFPPAYLLEEKQLSGSIVIHNLSFFQEGTDFIGSIQQERQSLKKYLPQLGFTQAQVQREIQKRAVWIKKHEYQSYPFVSALNLTNLSVCRREDRYEIIFFYDEQRSGAPVRRGHNRDFQTPGSPFFGKDILNETAFVLSQNQYGRIIWNERRTDYDIGEWYYQLHIYNLFYLGSQMRAKALQGKSFPKDIFVKNRPDFEYKQLAFLY